MIIMPAPPTVLPEVMTPVTFNVATPRLLFVFPMTAVVQARALPSPTTIARHPAGMMLLKLKKPVTEMAMKPMTAPLIAMTKMHVPLIP